MARRCMVNVSHPTSWCGPLGRWLKGLAFALSPGCFEVDPNTVLGWLIEVADHATAFSRYFLHDVRVTQVQLDELFALLSAVKAGAVSETEAICRLSLAPVGLDCARSGE